MKAYFMIITYPFNNNINESSSLEINILNLIVVRGTTGNLTNLNVCDTNKVTGFVQTLIR